jgi:hypothetical protein
MPNFRLNQGAIMSSRKYWTPCKWIVREYFWDCEQGCYRGAFPTKRLAERFAEDMEMAEIMKGAIQGRNDFYDLDGQLVSRWLVSQE